MRRLNLLTGSAVAGLLLGAAGAQAADMPVYYEPVPEFGGWYLRGDIGASHQVSDEIDSPYFDEIAAGGGSVNVYDSEWEPSAFIGFGVGYVFNDWFRTDFTAEYRFKSDFDGFDTYDSDNDGTIDGSNRYDGDKEEAVFLVNGYVDLPAWGNFRPFVGAGVGASWIQISDFSDIDPVSGADGYSGDKSSWNFAWALHAGASFAINDRTTFEIAYRYLNMGDAGTENLLSATGVDFEYNPFDFDNVASHDIKLAVRYMFY